MVQNIEKRRNSTKRRRRLLNIYSKIYDLETLCNIKVALFMQSQENK